MEKSFRVPLSLGALRSFCCIDLCPGAGALREGEEANGERLSHGGFWNAETPTGGAAT